MYRNCAGNVGNYVKIWESLYGGRQATYIKNRYVSKIEQTWAKKALSHAWIGADGLWKPLLLFEIFKAVVRPFQNTIMIVDV